MKAGGAVHHRPSYLSHGVLAGRRVGTTADRQTHTGQELAPAFARWRTGCCGVIGPVPQPLWIRCAPNCEEFSLSRTHPASQGRSVPPSRDSFARATI